MQMNGAEAVTTELSRDLGGETRRNGKAPANGETSVQSPKSLRIDPEFRSLIPPLTDDEFTQLEANIIAEGCREPLIVWNGVVVDGHNRYEICSAHGLDFNTVAMSFADREAAMDWMDANQLGRRNITPDQFTLLLGRRYNRAKKAQNDGGAGTTKTTVDQIEPRW